VTGVERFGSGGPYEDSIAYSRVVIVVLGFLDPRILVEVELTGWTG
jgi:hypothetical protein